MGASPGWHLKGVAPVTFCITLLKSLADAGPGGGGDACVLHAAHAQALRAHWVSACFVFVRHQDEETAAPCMPVHLGGSGCHSLLIATDKHKKHRCPQLLPAMAGCHGATLLMPVLTRADERAPGSRPGLQASSGSSQYQSQQCQPEGKLPLQARGLRPGNTSCAQRVPH